MLIVFWTKLGFCVIFPKMPLRILVLFQTYKLDFFNTNSFFQKLSFWVNKGFFFV